MNIGDFGEFDKIDNFGDFGEFDKIDNFGDLLPISSS